MTKRNFIIVLISTITCFLFLKDNNLYGQSTADTSTVIDCFTNFGDLELKLSNIGTITSETEFKISTFCPQGNYALHDSLNIDSVAIYIAVTTTDPEAKIGVKFDDELSQYFKVIKVWLNNVIEIETAVIDSGILINDSTTLNYSNSVDVVKVIVDIYENGSTFRQDTLGLGF